MTPIGVIFIVRHVMIIDILMMGTVLVRMDIIVMILKHANHTLININVLGGIYLNNVLDVSLVHI